MNVIITLVKSISESINNEKVILWAPHDNKWIQGANHHKYHILNSQIVYNLD